jgi:hypothetical protein
MIVVGDFSMLPDAGVVFLHDSACTSLTIR